MTHRVITTCDTCPWTGEHTSPARAAYAYRKHSCDRQNEAAARKARTHARATADGQHRDCDHPARHKHGTHAAYTLDRCRCRACRDASAAYERHRSRQRAYGRVAYVPAQPARTHIYQLRNQGMGWKRVAAAAGLSTSTVWKLLYGDPTRGQLPSKRIRPATEAAILTVTLDLADAATVPGHGTRRRLQALVANGWTQTHLGRRLGMSPANFGNLIHGARSDNVQAGTQRAVRALYDQLWNNQPDPARTVRALNTAARHGWAPPLAWDDDSIDDPTARPDLGQRTRVIGRGRPAEDVLEDLEFLLADQPLATAAQLADRLHVSTSAIQQACRRTGRDDLLTQLARNARLASPTERTTAA